jgi:hypothetical protein
LNAFDMKEEDDLKILERLSKKFTIDENNIRGQG